MQMHQLVPHLWQGDAISNQVLALDRLLTSWGHAATIYAQEIHPRLSGMCRRFQDYRPGRNSLTIYHHSIGAAEASELFLGCPGKRMLIYHNITPHHFFSHHSEKASRLCRQGREALRDFRQAAHLVLGDSPFNCQELARAGFADPRVLPILVDLEKFATTKPCPWTLAQREEGWSNFLFVGSFLPHKRQDDVIRAFAHYNSHINRRSQLVLVGGDKGMQSYLAELCALARSLGVEDHLFLGRDVSLAELIAHYQSADVFLCLSEHEGFCVPLLEAMHFQVPILAYEAAAVPGTLGSAGVLVKDKEFPAIAEMLHLLILDQQLREQVLKGQAQRLRDFRPESIASQFKSYLNELLAA